MPGGVSTSSTRNENIGVLHAHHFCFVFGENRSAPSLHGVFSCPLVTGAVKAQIMITINIITIIIVIVIAFYDVPSFDTQSRINFFLIFTTDLV